MKKTVTPRLKQLSPAKQRRLDDLLEKNSEGTITASEKSRLAELVAEAEQLMVANTRSVARFSRGKPAAAPAGAVPVTVWVTPGHARR